MSPPNGGYDDANYPSRVGVTTLALLSTIPAAGQTTAPSKLSPQQLNPATLNVNKRIAAPNKPITVLTPTANSLNGNKQARRAEGIFAE